MIASEALEILTPSYRPDFELCRELVGSVQQFGPPGTRHTLVVPPADAGLFSALASETVVVKTTRSLLPKAFLRLPLANAWVNLRRPILPIRGWIAQQIVKLHAVATSTADAVLIVDSDIQFVRPFTLSTFTSDGSIPLYRLPDAVSEALPRHMVWDDVAHRLLGLESDRSPRRPDYICWPCLWDPSVVRELLHRVESTVRRPWTTVVAGELHFSEMVLYGVFVDALIADPAPPTTTDMHCLCFSDEERLDAASLDRILDDLTGEKVAVMISARSGTDVALRRDAIRRALAGPARSA